MEVLPVTGNGKVDRKALPKPQDEPQGSVSAPRNEVETTVRDVFAEVLNLSPELVGLDQDFVGLGGTSLLAGKAVSMLRVRLRAPKLPATALYTHSTVARLAACAEPLVQPAGAAEAQICKL